MANQPRPDNPGRVVRVDDVLWSDVRRIAAGDETTPSDVIREAARQYVRRRDAAARRRKPSAAAGGR